MSGLLPSLPLTKSAYLTQNVSFEHRVLSNPGGAVGWVLGRLRARHIGPGIEYSQRQAKFLGNLSGAMLPVREIAVSTHKR